MIFPEAFVIFDPPEHLQPVRLASQVSWSILLGRKGSLGLHVNLSDFITHEQVWIPSYPSTVDRVGYVISFFPSIIPV